MRFTSTAFVASLATQQVAANWDLLANAFNSPSNCDNKCVDKQSTGWDFSDLVTGQVVASYGGSSFSGFTCATNSLLKRGVGADVDIGLGGSKCIAGSISAEAGPGFGGAAFSLQGATISSDFDVDVECHYGMPDGSTCKQTVACGQSGTSFTNKQCGGATSVSFQQPSHATKSCGFTMHSVSFDCSTKSSAVPYTATTSSAATTTEAYTTSTKSLATYSTPSATTTLVTYSTPTSSTSKSTITSTSSVETPGHLYPSKSSSTSSSTASSTTTALSSYSSTTTSKSSSSSSTSSSTSTTSSAAVYTSTTSTTSKSSSSATAMPTAGCPDIVPSCLNTWMWESGCKDNTDASCYCKNEQFINDVMDCISCWGSDCSARSAAASYLVGICGDYVQDNCALVTAVPTCATTATSTATKTATTTVAPVTVYATTTKEVTITSCGSTVTNCPAASTIVTSSVMTITSVVTATPTTTSTSAPAAVHTTITYSSVITVSGSSSTLTTTMTVPAVTFSTASATAGASTSSVGLYQPTPASNTASATSTKITTTTKASSSSVAAAASATTTKPATFSGAASHLGVSFAAAAGAVVAVLL